MPDDACGSNKGRLPARCVKNYKELVKLADQEIRRIIIVAQQRNLRPLSQFFAYEYSPIPLSLCDIHNVDLFNQQTKAKAIDFLKKTFPSSFPSTCTISTHKSAIVIDGGSLLENKPHPSTRTIRDYAIQLLEHNIRDLFGTHVSHRIIWSYISFSNAFLKERVDVVFDTITSKQTKQFIKRYEHDSEKHSYDLKDNDRMESPFGKFVQSNRGALAECVRQCWMEPELIQRLPPGVLLIVGGPDSTAIKLEHGLAPQPDYFLETTHIEAVTRILLHVNAISLDQYQRTVFTEANE